jgi:hypothetical protein
MAEGMAACNTNDVIQRYASRRSFRVDEFFGILLDAGSGIYGGSWQTGRAVLAAEVPRLTVFRLASAEESNPVEQPGEATRAAG